MMCYNVLFLTLFLSLSATTLFLPAATKANSFHSDSVALQQHLKKHNFVIFQNETVCMGTSHRFSSSNDDYRRLKRLYENCAYIDGNLEIVNLNPFYNMPPNMIDQTRWAEFDANYDFSFLDSIKEISGYLLVHGNMLRSLRLKNLRIVRGKNLMYDKYSVFIHKNSRLNQLDLTSLREIRNGTVYVQNNPNLCHMNDVNWLDLLDNQKFINDRVVVNNAPESACPKCQPPCWFPGEAGVQKLSKVICHSSCGSDTRCFGPGEGQCCDSYCSAGCTQKGKDKCIACKKLMIASTRECVDTCPARMVLNLTKNEKIINPEGMFTLQDNSFCVKECPESTFYYDDYCVKKCPKNHKESEIDIQFSENFSRKVKGCKKCEGEECVKICEFDESITKFNIQNYAGCEIINGNLEIIQPLDNIKRPDMPELTFEDLQSLQSIRKINGYVRIQLNTAQNLSFLRNLEVIRPLGLIQNKYALIITSSSIRTLALKNLKQIESGEKALNTPNLCLFNKINWNVILKSTAKANTSNDTVRMRADCDIDCDAECNGCWSTGPDWCQFCKNYRLNGTTCINKCNDGERLNGAYTYVIDPPGGKECGFCDMQCLKGCTGPSASECFECKNFYRMLDNGRKVCLSECSKHEYASNTGSGECLPCNEACDGCRGPGTNLTSDDGCLACKSALVRYDNEYSVVECINENTYKKKCEGDRFWDIVPPASMLPQQQHPLANKAVCRLCHDECDGCSEASKYKNKCNKCRNKESVIKNECVHDCGINEYLEGADADSDDSETKPLGTKCHPCHKQCNEGCSGPHSYQCKRCASKKITLEQIKRISLIYEMTNDKNTNNLRTALDEYNELTSNYEKSNQTMLRDEIVFCIEDCPKEAQYRTNEFFCTDQKNLEATSSKQSQSQSSSSKNNLIFKFITVLFAFFCFIIAVRFIVIYLVKRAKNKEQDNIKRYIDERNQKRGPSTIPLISSDSLHKRKFIGSGQYGNVYEGFLTPDGVDKTKGFKVAIKCLSNLKQAETGNNELIDEAKMLASVDHKYCIKFYGICISEPVMIAITLIEYGSVVSFCKKNRHQINELMLLTWCQQIAEGMAYLESMGIVHRDLAARNILVESHYHIRITDFGLAKSLQANNQPYKATKDQFLPLKWLAMESMKEYEFTSKSDVWSFGVCAWEILTLCDFKPYQEIVDIKTLYSSLKRGIRLNQPQIARVEVYAVLLSCWFENPNSRPKFEKLSAEFSDMTKQPLLYLNLKELINNDSMNHPAVVITTSEHRTLINEYNMNELDEENDRGRGGEENRKKSTYNSAIYDRNRARAARASSRNFMNRMLSTSSRRLRRLIPRSISKGSGGYNGDDLDNEDGESETRSDHLINGANNRQQQRRSKNRSSGISSFRFMDTLLSLKRAFVPGATTITDATAADNLNRLESQISSGTTTTCVSNNFFESSGSGSEKLMIEMTDMDNKNAMISDDSALIHSSISSSSSSTSSSSTSTNTLVISKSFNNHNNRNNKTTKKHHSMAAPTTTSMPSRSNSSSSSSNGRQLDLSKFKLQTCEKSYQPSDGGGADDVDRLNNNNNNNNTTDAGPILKHNLYDLNRAGSFQLPKFRPPTVGGEAAYFRQSNITNTNSDYLEPVMNNIRQNMEYFGQEGKPSAAATAAAVASSKKASTTADDDYNEIRHHNHQGNQIIIMPEPSDELLLAAATAASSVNGTLTVNGNNNLKNGYYNDEIEKIINKNITMTSHK